VKATFGRWRLHIDGDKLALSYEGKPIDEAVLQVFTAQNGEITVRMHDTSDRGNDLEQTKQYRMFLSSHLGIDRWEQV
jgi:hypothetical protein